MLGMTGFMNGDKPWASYFTFALSHLINLISTFVASVACVNPFNPWDLWFQGEMWSKHSGSNATSRFAKICTPTLHFTGKHDVYDRRQSGDFRSNCQVHASCLLKASPKKEQKIRKWHSTNSTSKHVCLVCRSSDRKQNSTSLWRQPLSLCSSKNRRKVQVLRHSLAQGKRLGDLRALMCFVGFRVCFDWFP